MSWDLSLFTELDGNKVYLAEWNYTHNCNPMVRDAGLPEWPYRVDGWPARRLGQVLDGVVRNLRTDPERYRAMNPPNKWGDYDGLLETIEDVVEACRQFPSARVRMWA